MWPSTWTFLIGEQCLLLTFINNHPFEFVPNPAYNEWSVLILFHGNSLNLTHSQHLSERQRVPMFTPVGFWCWLGFESLKDATIVQAMSAVSHQGQAGYSFFYLHIILKVFLIPKPHHITLSHHPSHTQDTFIK